MYSKNPMALFLTGVFAIVNLYRPINACAQTIVSNVSSNNRYSIVSCTDGIEFSNLDIVSDSIKEAKNEIVSQSNLNNSSKTNEYKSVVIDTDVFNSISIKLNTEIYNETAEYMSMEHITKEFGSSGTKLYISFLKNINPLTPLALTLCETGSWADSRYTWSSAIYSRLLASNGVNMSKISIKSVNADTYIVDDLTGYMGCGSNCTAGTGTHYHYLGNNDNDSLGPLQILRRYVENESITYDCGEVTSDLMSWQDNVEYFMHRQASAFSSEDCNIKNYTVNSPEELVAIMAVAHNTGSSFMTSDSTGSLWKSPKAIYEYCRILGSDKSHAVLEKYIDTWYESAIEKEINGESFTMAGTALSNSYDEILKELGVVKSNYSNGWAHKQYYPLKAVLNYMALERLYYSGEEVG